MVGFNTVTNTVRVSLTGLANLFCGCSHGKTTFPITLQASTYIVCLECGRHLPYDWSRMRVTGRLMAWPPALPARTLAPTNKASR
jgi:hypothetical protein